MTNLIFVKNSSALCYQVVGLTITRPLSSSIVQLTLTFRGNRIDTDQGTAVNLIIYIGRINMKSPRR